VEQVTGIGGESISIAHQFQGGFSWITPVEKVTKILRSFLKVSGF
jgi:hypothetical protein